MDKKASVCLSVSAAMAVALLAISPETSARASGGLRVGSERTGPIGRLDGIYELPGGTLLATDWNSGSLVVPALVQSQMRFVHLQK
jgi:hypothetical protein